MSGVLVEYFDVAVGAKEAFNAKGSVNSVVLNNDFLKSDRPTPQRYDVPFELNSMILDGGANFLPEDNSANIGFISEEMSNENGEFDVPVSLELKASEAFTSIGLMFIFDEIKNIFPTHINIQWYNGDLFLDEADFYPTNARYFCDKRVDFFNKIIVTFFSLNVPLNRLRLSRIDYGLNAEFSAKELRKAKIIQELDPISTNVPINTFDFTLDSKRDLEFSFQAKQPLNVIFNGEIKGATFIKSAKRKSKTLWDIKSEDYIGLMDSIDFKGGIYNNKNALELIDEIFSVAKIPYVVLGTFENISVTGHIPYTTCREALMQVIFAIGAVADTSNSDKVKIFALSQDVSQEIPKRRIMQGQSFERQSRITAVELTAHAYAEIEDARIVYDAKKSGSGNKILVEFPEPLHDLTISTGRIIESGSNYAIISANSDSVLTGKKYDHSKTIYRKENPFVLATDLDNVVSIEDATLVSSENVDNILLSCYNYLVNTEQTKMKIIDGTKDQNTTVGDLISYETEYLGNKQGRIIKQSFALVGGMLVKDSVVR